MEIKCKYCEKPLEQNPKARKKEFCNKKCYHKWYEKTGGYSRAMKRYNSKSKNRRKNLIRAIKQYEKNKKSKPPKSPKFCEVCGKKLTGNQTCFCSAECERASPRLKSYHREYHRRQTVGKRIIRLEAELIRTIEKRRMAAYIVSKKKGVVKRADKRIKRINKTLKELKNEK